MREPVIGISLRRTDGHAKVTGAATYVPDIVLPCMLRTAEKVRHAGEAVAVVLADSALQAQAPVRKEALDLEELPFVLDPR